VPPAPPPHHQVPSTDGVTIALHDLGGDGPPLLLCHPTGFLGMTWAPLATELGAVAHSWALDFRGHGDSTTPASGDYAWTGMADDVLAVVDHLGLAGVRACGHSMGGGALLMAEHRRPGTFSGLWLFEPIAFPPLEGQAARPAPLAEAARKRRPTFPDRDAAYANFASKPPLDSLTPAALRAYVDHGLRDTADGEAVALKCAPEVESAVFQAALSAPTFGLLPEIRCRVTVATGGDSVGPAQIAPMIADRLPNGILECHPEVTHFGPMEDPGGTARSVLAALDLG
jgi:pimeloyl-ACP methyl ester carboxylesterase